MRGTFIDKLREGSDYVRKLSFSNPGIHMLIRVVPEGLVIDAHDQKTGLRSNKHIGFFELDTFSDNLILPRADGLLESLKESRDHSSPV